MGDFLIKKHLGHNNETCVITCLDAAGNRIISETLNEGLSESVEVNLRDIVSCIFKHNAPCVIISHNHTSGNALPSREDINMTVELVKALSQLQITLLDHIIVARNDYVSMRQSAEYRAIFK